MKGNAPKLLLTGSHAERKKKPRPNFASVRCERETSSHAIRITMPKMLSAQRKTRALKVPSAIAELPRPRRKVRTAEGFTGCLASGGGVLDSDTNIFAGCVTAESCSLSSTSPQSIHP